MMLNELLTTMIAKGASDLHLKVDSPPRFRIHGELVTPRGNKLGEADVWKLLSTVLDESDRERFEHEQDVDVLYFVPGIGRFRVNVSRQMKSTSVVMRHIPTEIPSIRDLGLPPVIEELALLPRGMVLVTGTTGSGKSTTLAAMVNHINISRKKTIVTVEDPVEFVHVDRRSMIRQRSVGIDVPSFSRGLKYALRQDPDVILIGEMRDQETIQTALTAAETGHLVLSTLHTINGPQTVERVLNAFPEGLLTQVRMQLSQTLRGVISQRLVRRRDGRGRIAVLEILLGTPTVRKQILDGDIPRLFTTISEGNLEGMQSFNQALLAAYLAGQISLDDGLETSDNPDELKLQLRTRGFEQRSYARPTLRD
ncbi:MAG: PilT/PilU family type 4a pilus ATPase [Candidatus Riflebacteria bacterium]|nr:PilT/PilU family type 4a pilus ATPase [Candidatus Riflebacteria bacterium]